jgi:hypothetical protein
VAPAWRFGQRDPMAKQRDPVQGEFFITEGIRTVAAALVREAIQNSLDAATGPVARVRFFLSGDDAALGETVAAPYFDGLWDHIDASGADATKQPHKPCRFLTIEDFGTSGLTGDPAQTTEPTGDTVNNFFYFVRAEGKSGKSGSDRGRWGLGKYVFVQASEANTLFALTARADDEPTGSGPLLIGQAVLRHHQIGMTGYEPDGWWSEVTDARVPVPVSDEHIIGQFRADWSVDRTDEPGLSVVVPYVNHELSGEQLLDSVVADYFVAILAGSLVVDVEAPDVGLFHVARGTIAAVIDSLANHDGRNELQRMADLAAWGQSLTPDQYFLTELNEGNPRWGPELVSSKARAGIDEALRTEGRAAVRVPVRLMLKSGEQLDSWLDILFATDPEHRGTPLFVREGIIVSEVRSQSLPRIRALVLIDDEPLANMLGDAEGPAHTNWSDRSDKLRAKYRYGPQWLTFIRQAPWQIMRIVEGEDESVDERLAMDFFSIPRPEAENVRSGGRGGDPGVDTGPAVPPPSTPPRAVRVSAVDGGFSLHLDPAVGVKAVSAEIAYDVRRGNALSRWRPEDFEWKDLDITVTGGRVKEFRENRAEFDVSEPTAFSVHVRGFDPRRDLRIFAKEVIAE